MKVLSVLALSTACSISLSFIATVQRASAVSESEPNNSFATRQFLPSDTSTVDGQLSSGDLDFFTSSGLNTGSLFTAEITSGTIDSTLGLLDDSGNILATNDDKDDNSVLSVLTGSVPESGNLNLAVTGYDDYGITGAHSQFGSYTLSLDTFTLSQPSPNPTIINGGFEIGNFTGWTTIGETSIETSAFGSTPTSGSSQALLSTGGATFADSIIEKSLGLEAGTLDNLGNRDATQGSAIRQTFTAEAGDVLTFDWNFLTGEETPNYFNDSSFVSINSVSKLADTTFPSFVSSLTPFIEETGFQTFSFTIPTTGTYTLGLGVTDVGEDTTNSGLLVDNVKIASVPEPSSALGVLVCGALGAVSVLRCKQRQKATGMKIQL